MINLCMVSYYGPRAPIDIAENCLSVYCKVYDFPMMHNKNEYPETYHEKMIDYIKENKIDVCLWWYVAVPTDIFKKIRDATGVEYIYYNWDEPFNWSDCDLANKASYFEAVFVCCKETLVRYTDNGTKNAVYLLPGFDPEVHHIIRDYNHEDSVKYGCDISFCCTNLYEDVNTYPDQYINRKILIDDIYNNQEKYGYTFHIYGIEKFATLYPKSYKGFADYFTLNKIFNYSKINLCTHVIYDKDGYMNERCILVSAAGGLLLVDDVKGNVIKDAIILHKTDYLQQIADIVGNYEKYVDVRKKLYTFCRSNFTYQIWAKKIHDEYLVNLIEKKIKQS